MTKESKYELLLNSHQIFRPSYSPVVWRQICGLPSKLWSNFSRECITQDPTPWHHMCCDKFQGYSWSFDLKPLHWYPTYSTREHWIQEFIKRIFNSRLFWAARAAEKKNPNLHKYATFEGSFFLFSWAKNSEKLRTLKQWKMAILALKKIGYLWNFKFPSDQVSIDYYCGFPL